MHTETRLQALSDFLKTHRARLTPQAAGLPAGGRRRTPGLRREEVAQLAGVSTTWYTWLEQGREIQVSASVLDCIAAALQLNVDERNYLFSLALDSGLSPHVPPSEPPLLSAPLRKIVQELTLCPTIISDRRCNIIGWNEAAAHVFLDFNRVPVEERNLIRLLFTRKELRRLAVNWEHFASGYLAIFRAYYGQYVGDPWYADFVEEMSGAHPNFHDLWHQAEVSTAPEVVIHFRHSRAGGMQFHLTSLQATGGSDLRFSVYTPAPDTLTESKLKKLMED